MPLFFLEDTLEWVPNQGQNFSLVEVPKGFITDIASVPFILWSDFQKLEAMPMRPSLTTISIGHRQFRVKKPTLY
jgi:hypothetical protein